MSSQLMASLEDNKALRERLYDLHNGMTDQRSNLAACQRKHDVLLAQNEDLKAERNSLRFEIQQKDRQIQDLQKPPIKVSEQEAAPQPLDVARISPLSRQWKLTNVIGSGTFGVVCEAVDLVTHQPVAVKMEPANSPYALLEKEFELYRYIHEGAQNIRGFPKMHHLGECGPYRYMVMDRLGPSLKDLWVASGYRFVTSFALKAGIQILDRLEHVHNMGIVHRDIKPDNIMAGIQDPGCGTWLTLASHRRLSTPTEDTSRSQQRTASSGLQCTPPSTRTKASRHRDRMTWSP